MDAFLALIVAMILFAALIVAIHRSAKTVAFIGLLVVVVLVLRSLGVLG